jgi:spermidine synthase
MMLSVTLLMANLVTPDVVFAKGFYSGGSSSYSTEPDSYEVQHLGKLWGLGFLAAGGIWLINIFTRSRDE